MAKIVWDKTGERKYETGTDRGVVYKKSATGTYPKGEGWNGLTKVGESPEGATSTAKYANNNKYGSLISQENFKGNIEAFTYPDIWEEIDGSREITAGVRVGQQLRKGFGLTWRTLIGNDTEGTSYGYKINIVYEGTAAPSKRDSQTINDTPEMNTLAWDFDTTPVEIPGVDADGKPFRPSAKVTIDSTKVDAAKLKALEDILYGTDDAGGVGTGTEPRLPLPEELFTLLGVTGG